MCQVSHFTCKMSHIYMYIFQWRVCYQQHVTRLVYKLLQKVLNAFEYLSSAVQERKKQKKHCFAGFAKIWLIILA